MSAERTVTSVTANTRADGDELLTLAARLSLSPTITPYPFHRAPQALQDLERGAVTGAAVLVMDQDPAVAPANARNTQPG